MSQNRNRVYVTQGAFMSSVVSMFLSKGYTIVDRLENADILCLTGGADIDPMLYGEKALPGTWFNESRDKIEIEAFNEAVERGLMIFGICRGGQLANCLNGGKLWQHIEGHGSRHPITDLKTGRVVTSSSIHHQMFRPAPDAEIVATCNEAYLKVAEHEIWEAKNGTPNDDVEVCWYAKSRSLCIQGHPEVGPDSFTDYCFELLERYAS